MENGLNMDLVASQDGYSIDDARRVLEGEVFMDLLLDDGFKQVFGNDGGKTLMIGLLNAVLPRINILNLSYLPNQAEHFGSDTKKSVYDVKCELQDGSEIIVEVQRSPQKDFFERALYYGSMPIARQVTSGKDYTLHPVYVVAFVDFQLNHSESWTPKYETEYRLIELGSGDPMTDKLSFTFIELGRFKKALGECGDFKEKLYFCLKNMHKFQEIPEQLTKDAYFKQLAEYSSIRRLTGEQLIEYAKSMTTERDKACQIAYAHEKGIEKGIEQGRAEAEARIAKNLLDLGISTDDIANSTNLTKEQIAAL